jgi:hypothetical protein
MLRRGTVMPRRGMMMLKRGAVMLRRGRQGCEGWRDAEEEKAGDQEDQPPRHARSPRQQPAQLAADIGPAAAAATIRVLFDHDMMS